jgi:ankyrin repeat protein
VELLLKNNAEIEHVNSQGENAFIYACQCARINIIEMLIEIGVDINVRNNKGQTAWDILHKESPEKYQQLIQNNIMKQRCEKLYTEDLQNIVYPVPDYNI